MSSSLRSTLTAGLHSVSYTHLDVYKRQAHGAAKETGSKRERLTISVIRPELPELSKY